jgi:hypothetical protein
MRADNITTKIQSLATPHDDAPHPAVTHTEDFGIIIADGSESER